MRLERPVNTHPIRSKSPQEKSLVGMKTVIPRRSRSASPERNMKCNSEDYRYDTHNRLHVNYPRTGRLHVFNRAMKFHSSTVETHANDLMKVLSFDINAEKKYAVSIACDNGPDWSFKSPLTQTYMGRIWRDLNLDYLVLVSYAPGHSAENMIEHAWAPLGKFLVGVTLPATLPGENVPPCRQSGLTRLEKEIKEAKVLDKAIDHLNEFWSNRTYHGYTIASSKVPCYEETASKKYNDYQIVKGFFDAGIKARAENEAFRNVNDEYKLLVQHCIKSTYRLEFIKCQVMSCQHCGTRPIHAMSMMAFLRKFGSRMFSPTPSVSIPGSFSTFLELSFSQLSQRRSDLDENCPSIKSKGPYQDTKCNSQGCNYIFSSAADAKRHQTLIYGHNSTSTKKRQQKRKKSGKNGKRPKAGTSTGT